MSNANKVFLKFIKITETHSGEVNKLHRKMLYISHYTYINFQFFISKFILKFLPNLTNYSCLAMQTDIILRNREGQTKG